MVTKQKDKIYTEFSRRLREACKDAGYDPDARGFSKRLGSMGGIGYKGAEKWLDGVGMPGMGNGVLLATSLHVSFNWLMAGQGNKSQSANDELSSKSTRTADKDIARPVYPVDPFKRLGKLSELWPFLTDESQEKVVELAEALKRSILHGSAPPMPPWKAKGKTKVTTK